MPKSLKLKLDIRDSADYRIPIKVRRKGVVAGTDAVYTIEPEELGGFTGSVDLTITGLPTGATGALSASTVAHDAMATATIGTTGVTGGSYSFLINSVSAEAGDYDWLLVDYASRLIDWTYCGVPGGIPNRTTVYQTMTTANSLAEINAAIAACTSGQVVVLSAGAYSLGAINFASKSGVTLRGEGAGNTVITTTATNAIIADYMYFLTADGIAVSDGAWLAKGSTSVTLASAPSAAFSVGNLMMITQDDGPDMFGTTGIGIYHRSGLSTPWGISATRCLRFTTRITDVTGNVVTFATPIPWSYTYSLNPAAYPLNGGPPISQCGIENLTLVGSGTSNRAVSFIGADRCWVKDVEARNFVGTNGVIYYQYAAQSEMRRNYVHDVVGFPSQADGYPYFLYYGCAHCLVEDNIAYQAAYSILNGSVGNAILYNYDIDARRAAHSWIEQSQVCNHGPHGIMNLYEGNIVQRLQNDGYHGSTSHTMIFRNQIHGLTTGITSPTNRRMIDLCRGSYYHSAVGNIIGDTAWTPAQYEYDPGEQVVTCVYILGFPGMDSTSMDAFTTVPWVDWSKPTDVPDADVKGTLLRNGNYDYLNGAAVWVGGIERDIPPSLVYSSKPAFFGSLTWPNIGPDVSGLVQSSPAKNRWDTYVVSETLSDLFADET